MNKAYNHINKFVKFENLKIGIIHGLTVLTTHQYVTCNNFTKTSVDKVHPIRLLLIATQKLRLYMLTMFDPKICLFACRYPNYQTNSIVSYISHRLQVPYRNINTTWLFQGCAVLSGKRLCFVPCKHYFKQMWKSRSFSFKVLPLQGSVWP